MGHESTYKKRYIWIDAQDRSFHWNKQPDRSSVHKSVSLAEGGDVQAVEFRSRPAKYRGQGPEPALCLSLVLNSGDVIDLQVRKKRKSVFLCIKCWLRHVTLCQHFTASMFAKQSRRTAFRRQRNGKKF